MSKVIVTFPRLVAALLGAVSVVACSGESPLAPSESSVVARELAARGSQTASGVYQLSFTVWRAGILEEVSSLVVRRDELILKAFVSNSSGAAAQKGTVTFEYCSYKGRPPNDITRPDEAPKEACEQGLADWARLSSISVGAGTCPTLGTGYACLNFGLVRIPRDVGFRFRYSPQGSGIASGTSESKNFTWVEG
jgi:hypothetical protein